MTDDDDWNDSFLAVDRAKSEVHAVRLACVARSFEWVILVAGLIAVIAGIVVAFQKETASDGTVTHPHIVEGIEIGIGAIAAAMLYWAVARSVRLFGEYVELRLRGDDQLENLVFYGRSARTKECPECLEDAWRDAKLCPSCGHEFGPPPPVPHKIRRRGGNLTSNDRPDRD